MDGLERLRLQHEQLLEAFDELEFTGDQEPRLRLLAHIAQRLKAHAAVEDEVFYPVVERTGGSEAAAKVAEATESHLAIDVLLDEMMGQEVTAAKVAVLRDLVKRHFADEERTLFPLAGELEDAPRQELADAIDDYFEEFGDGADDELSAP